MTRVLIACRFSLTFNANNVYGHNKRLKTDGGGMWSEYRALSFDLFICNKVEPTDEPLGNKYFSGKKKRGQNKRKSKKRKRIQF